MTSDCFHDSLKIWSQDEETHLF